MKTRYKIAIWTLLTVAGLGAIVFFLRDNNFAVLNTKGTIAEQQRGLLVTATLLMLIVVVPVFAMTIGFALRYREGNKKATYKPDWHGSKFAEFTWWLIPFIIIAILSAIIWRSSHALDPFKPIESDKKAVTIQVVALEWKWLFIYPEQDIATVNYVQFPEDTPVNFAISADAPMNSFWIPQLGGQVYAMSGMTTKLHLMADDPGRYDGVSANLSGEGFADMKFVAESKSQTDFDDWVEGAQNSSESLTYTSYEMLATPSKANAQAIYRLEDHNLYDKIIMKYMAPPTNKEEEHMEHEGEHHH